MKEIKAPAKCPSCDSDLELVKDQLFCRSANCYAKVNKQIEHYAKTMKIKGLGPKTIEKLDLESITELYDLTLDELKPYLGEKLASKLQGEIDKSRTSELSVLLAAFSIPLIGVVAATKIASKVSSIDEITFKVCKDAGLGDKATGHLLGWIKGEWETTYKNLPVKLIKKAPKPVVNKLNKTVVMTGKVEGYTRGKLKLELEALGFDVKTTVSSKTNYVLAGANKSKSSTETKAEGLGIPIVNTLSELLKLETAGENK